MAGTDQSVAKMSDRDAREAVAAIANALEKEADDRVAKRDPIEKRWLDDLAQFHGKYSPEIQDSLQKDKKSSLYINQTRPKTNVMESRLSDMLFPTDDRNWGIQPTPVPDLTVEAENVAKAFADAQRAAAERPENEELAALVLEADRQNVLIQAQIDVARKRSRAMEEEIDDHLTECNYAIQSREVIRDGCKLGTGVMKGPVTDGKTRRSWKEAAKNVFTLNFEDDEQPAFWRVDPWNFFPDSDSTNMSENEAVFERHMFNPKQLRQLSRRSGFDKDAIRRILKFKPQATAPSYLADIRSITSSYNDMIRDRYHIWEYHGPITAEDLATLSVALDDPEKAIGIDEDADPLDEIQVVIWFCQGEVLKFGPHPLDSEDPLYSVFNLEKDEASIFGFGIPHIMRDGQTALSGAWRVLMDNMGLSSGPQIVINEDVIEPVDGVWVISPRKLWRRKGTALPDAKAFEVFNIPSNMEELLAVIETSKENIDEETALPMLAQGEQGATVTKTAQGMSMLMNSVNVVFRRIVKNWDDDMTTANIRRMYDWLMQFSPKEHIKGDYKVDARGTSVLLVRETQSANMMVFLERFSGHQVLGRFLKKDGLPALRRLVQSMMIPQDEVIKSDTEISADDAKIAEQPPPPDPEMEKISASLNLQQLKNEGAMQEGLLDRETQLIALAQLQNLDLEKLRAASDEAMTAMYAKYEDRQKDRDSKERIFAAEAAISAKEGASGGGYL